MTSILFLEMARWIVLCVCLIRFLSFNHFLNLCCMCLLFLFIPFSSPFYPRGLLVKIYDDCPSLDLDSKFARPVGSGDKEKRNIKKPHVLRFIHYTAIQVLRGARHFYLTSYLAIRPSGRYCVKYKMLLREAGNPPLQRLRWSCTMKRV